MNVYSLYRNEGWSMIEKAMLAQRNVSYDSKSDAGTTVCAACVSGNLLT